MSVVCILKLNDQHLIPIIHQLNVLNDGHVTLSWVAKLHPATLRNASTGCQKITPRKKFDISGIVVIFFPKFIMLTEDDSGHIGAYPVNSIAIFGCV